jgi:hypothetical protein
MGSSSKNSWIVKLNSDVNRTEVEGLCVDAQNANVTWHPESKKGTDTQTNRSLGCRLVRATSHTAPDRPHPPLPTRRSSRPRSPS